MSEHHPTSDDQAETAAPVDETSAEPHDPPVTGDIVIDAALRDLAAAEVSDLDAQVHSGEQLQRTLQGRLSDLGG